MQEFVYVIVGTNICGGLSDGQNIHSVCVDKRYAENLCKHLDAADQGTDNNYTFYSVEEVFLDRLSTKGIVL